MTIDKIINQEKNFVIATGKWDFDCDKAIQVEKGRTNQIGGYDSNNGVIAFVDNNKYIWVGKWSKENEQALKDAGYKHTSIYVPYSNNFGLGKILQH
jgi:hypothetical protein